MPDCPVEVGDWIMLGPTTLIHKDGAVIFHDQRRFYALEVDVQELRHSRGENRKFLEALNDR